jgi:ketosteroid isomerase-like protein
MAIQRLLHERRFIYPEVQGMTSKPFFIATALTLVCASAVAASAPEAEMREVLSAHEQALGAHDLAGLMALYAPGDKTVVMGTTPPERWVGEAQIADAYRNFFADFDAGTMERDCPWMQIEVSGDVGWITANCEYTDSLKGESRSFALNVTVVMQNLDGAWKLRTMHFSNPTAP